MEILKLGIWDHFYSVADADESSFRCSKIVVFQVGKLLVKRIEWSWKQQKLLGQEFFFFSPHICVSIF
jgi:hypothetical protein